MLELNQTLANPSYNPNFAYGNRDNDNEAD